jgi:hypothetical protein
MSALIASDLVQAAKQLASTERLATKPSTGEVDAVAQRILEVQAKILGMGVPLQAAEKALAAVRRTGKQANQTIAQVQECAMEAQNCEALMAYAKDQLETMEEVVCQCYEAAGSGSSCKGSLRKALQVWRSPLYLLPGSCMLAVASMLKASLPPDSLRHGVSKACAWSAIPVLLASFIPDCQRRSSPGSAW